jgi:hypothetical protein
VIRRLFSSLSLAVAAIAVPSTAHTQVDIDFPLGIGLRIPLYDRVNGLTLPFGPTITFGDERVVIEPLIAYRSHLGKVDPSLRTRFNFDTIFALTVRGERGTFSNERWIRSDIINSIWSLAFGRDSRNYYRADRGELNLRARLATEQFQTEFYAGPLWENAWSTGWRAGENKEPASIFGKTNARNGLRRPNPLIDRGHIASAVAGAKLQYKTGGERFSTNFDVHLERAWRAPNQSKFTQVTLNQENRLQTIFGQRLEVDGHLVYTGGDPTPLQRYAYIGGSGTLTTINALTLGGDRLLFVDVRYHVPIPGLVLPFLGGPYIAPRFVMGAADVRKFGVPTQEFGARLGAGFLWVQYLRNPRTDRDEFSGGFSVPR